MAAELSAATQKRIAFLSLFDTLGGDYDSTIEVLDRLIDDGRFFDGAGRPTSARSNGQSRPSGRQGSSSRPSNSGRGRDQQGGGFSGNYRDPDGPPTENQVNAVLKMTSDYTEDELWEMSKQDVGNLISDLKS